MAVATAAMVGACELGIHYPEPRTVRNEDGLERACCRFCGGTILRMANVRRWRLSARLG